MSRHNRERRERNRAAKHQPAGTASPSQTRLLPGRAYVLTVRHDDACALLRGAGPCDCSPEVGRPVLVPAPDDN
jgi:hypothetical protein